MKILTNVLAHVKRRIRRVWSHANKSIAENYLLRSAAPKQFGKAVYLNLLIAAVVLVFVLPNNGLAAGSVGNSANTYYMSPDDSDLGNPCLPAFLAQTGIPAPTGTFSQSPNSHTYYSSPAAAAADVSVAFPGQVYLYTIDPALPQYNIPATYVYGIRGCISPNGYYIFSFFVTYDSTVANTPPGGSGQPGQPSISSVTFTGTPANPIVTIAGQGFNPEPAATNPGFTGSTGFDYGTALHIQDSTGTTAFSAGYYDPSAGRDDYIGLVISSYSDTSISYQLGSNYNTFYYPQDIFQLNEGDAFTVYVNGASYSGIVHYQFTCAALINGAVASPTTGRYSWSLDPTTISSSFTPNFGYTLAQAAQVCGFTRFDWQQTVIRLPDPSPFCQNNSNPDPAIPNPNPFCEVSAPFTSAPFPIHLTSLSAPFNDAPANGYSNVDFFNGYPFYYPQASLESTCIETNAIAGTGLSGCALFAVNAAGTILSFFDNPGDACLLGASGVPSVAYLASLALLGPIARSCGFNTSQPGVSIAFTTQLAGVNIDATGAVSAIPLGIGFSWTSNFNGTVGGISTTGTNGVADPGSGTGGVTVTSVSNTTLYDFPAIATAPPAILLSGSQVAVSSSGLAYSRVSQAFVGSVTVTNTSASAINGPLQVVLDSLTSGVSLLNATGSFGGFSYITIPAVATLAPGQSVSVNVQFKNFSNAVINFLPVVYAGGFN